MKSYMNMDHVFIDSDLVFLVSVVIFKTDVQQK